MKQGREALFSRGTTQINDDDFNHYVHSVSLTRKLRQELLFVHSHN